MSSVEIIVREDAKGKAKRDRKGGRVVKHLILSDGSNEEKTGMTSRSW